MKLPNPMSTGHCDDFWSDRLHFQRRYRGDLLAQPFMGNVAMGILTSETLVPGPRGCSYACLFPSYAAFHTDIINNILES